MAKMSICEELQLPIEDRRKCRELARRMWAAFISVHTGTDYAAAYEQIRLERTPEHFVEQGELTLLWLRDGIKPEDAAKSISYGGPADPGRIH